MLREPGSLRVCSRPQEIAQRAGLELFRCDFSYRLRFSAYLESFSCESSTLFELPFEKNILAIRALDSSCEEYRRLADCQENIAHLIALESS